MTTWQDDATIVDLKWQIDGASERIRTLEAQIASLRGLLAIAQAQRDDAKAQVFHHTRRGW